MEGIMWLMMLIRGYFCSLWVAGDGVRSGEGFSLKSIFAAEKLWEHNQIRKGNE